MLCNGEINTAEGPRSCGYESYLTMDEINTALSIEYPGQNFSVYSAGEEFLNVYFTEKELATIHDCFIRNDLIPHEEIIDIIAEVSMRKYLKNRKSKIAYLFAVLWSRRKSIEVQMDAEFCMLTGGNK